MAGETPLMIAINSGNNEIIELLGNHLPLHIALQSLIRERAVIVVVNEGSDPSAMDHKGCSAIDMGLEPSLASVHRAITLVRHDTRFHLVLCVALK